MSATVWKPTCPDCHSALVIDTDARVSTVIWRNNPGGMPFIEEGTRPATVAFCSGCDFAVELEEHSLAKMVQERAA